MSWICDLCSSNNEDSATECFVCGQAKPIKTRSREKPDVKETVKKTTIRTSSGTGIKKTTSGTSSSTTIKSTTDKVKKVDSSDADKLFVDRIVSSYTSSGRSYKRTKKTGKILYRILCIGFITTLVLAGLVFLLGVVNKFLNGSLEDVFYNLGVVFNDYVKGKFPSFFSWFAVFGQFFIDKFGMFFENIALIFTMFWSSFLTFFSSFGELFKRENYKNFFQNVRALINNIILKF